MRRTLALLAVLLLAAPAALAGNAKENTGCGLGTMIFGDSADDSILLQAFAVTTNGTSGNQTFGITSGTSECRQPASFVQNERLNEFVLANLDNLAKDVARGDGETLASLAELMEVPAAQRGVFYRNLQAHFTEIFPTPDVDYAHVVDAVVLVAARS